MSTNTPGTGMDAPTWRGAYDRWLILPQGRLNVIDFDFYRRVAEQGTPERSVWQFSWRGRTRFDPVWDMVLEGSTGFSGAFARQVTLNMQTADADLTTDLLGALEAASADGAVVLEGESVFLKNRAATPVAMQFDAGHKGGSYVTKGAARGAVSRKGLITLAAAGEFVGTFTARHGVKATVDHPPPVIWTEGPIERQRGRQVFPILHAGQKGMTVSGQHFGDDAHLFVDGRRASGSVRRGAGETVVITLSSLPPVGMHLLQVQVPDGMCSNDFIFHVTTDATSAAGLKRELDQAHVPPSQDPLAALVRKGDLAGVKSLLPTKAAVTARRADGSTPLITAALHGKLEIARYLIDAGADVSGTNGDGNTPLHVAAFLCRAEVVRLLLDKGASVAAMNGRGETALDVVSSAWNQDLSNFYTGIDAAVGLNLDLKLIEPQRPQMARLIREHARK